MIVSLPRCWTKISTCDVKEEHEPNNILNLYFRKDDEDIGMTDFYNNSSPCTFHSKSKLLQNSAEYSNPESKSSPVRSPDWHI